MPGAGDPYAAPRALAAFGLVALVLVMSPGTPGVGAPMGWTLAMLLGLEGVAAIANHPASSVWGVHGRFQGLVAAVLIAAALYAGTRLSREAARPVVRSVAIVMALIALVMLFQVARGTEPVGTFGNRAIAAQWLAVGVAMVGAYALVTRSGARWPYVAALLAGALALGATGTRGAIAAVLVAALVAGFAVTDPALRRRAVIAAAVVAASIAVGVALGGTSVTSKMTTQALRGGSAAARGQIAAGTVDMIADRPVLGVGPGRFLYEFPRYETADHARIEGADVRPDQAHSQPLQLAAEAGVPALLAWAVLMGAAVVAGFRRARNGDGVAFVATVGLTAYLAQASLGVAAVETDVLGWLLAGIAIASTAQARTSRGADWGRWLGAAVCVVGLAACLLYLRADREYAASQQVFDAGRIDEAQSLTAAATALDPFTDVYRVARADAAAYGSRADKALAVAALDQGLVLEPHSYDLAYSRAALMSDLGRPADHVAAAYGSAVTLYPQGLAVRRDAMSAYLAAGERSRARTLARGVLLLDPTDSVARDLVAP